MGKILNLLYNPVFIICLVIGFFILFLIYLQSYNQLTGSFWKFGPVQDEKGEYYKYMSFTMDNWVKVISVYIIILLTSLISSIYDNFYESKFKSHIESTDYSIISKLTTYIFLGIKPFMDIMYYIINFFAVANFQIQYLLPLFFGAYLGEIPYIADALAK